MSVFSTLDTLLDQRHSCRGFLDQPVERTLVERIVTTAQKVPSWCNSQPWQLIVLSAGETNRLRETLFDAASASAPMSPDVEFPERYQGTYKERRSDCGWQLYDAVGVAKGDRTASDRQMRENFRFFGAPHLALVTSPVELGAYGLLDCGAFVTGFMVAAQALGLASIAQAALAGYAPLVRKKLEIAEDRHILCGISFGYSDPAHPANRFRTARAVVDDVMEWR